MIDETESFVVRGIGRNLLEIKILTTSFSRADQTNRLVRGRKTFASRLTVQHLITGFLDDIPTGDLVTASGHHSIAGAVFPNGLWVQEMTLRPGGTLGGVDLAQAVLLGTTAVLGNYQSPGGLGYLG